MLCSQGISCLLMEKFALPNVKIEALPTLESEGPVAQEIKNVLKRFEVGIWSSA
ncbi:unnamed protein product [Brassica oleracea]|uniref:(rape) hypothetical protein n=1 Tax=Brassica napus TaxID=3708 RepID=A0A816JI30_BRANA|nr:unnamed protein product [Brassica napus]